MICSNKIIGFLLLIYINSINAQAACTTPSRQVGQCIPLRSCSVLYNIILQSGNQLTDDQRALISGSWCGTENGQHKVCCPRPTPPPTVPPTPVPPTPVPPTPVPLTPVPSTTEMSPPDGYTNHPNAKLFDLRSCGNVLHDRIHKGNKTEPFDFPWMAILQYEIFGEGIKQKCGGSIITARFILTAAHCISRLSSGTTLHSVVVGEHNTKTELDCIDVDDCAPPIQTIFVDRAIPHPTYNKSLFTNDIGLVRLQSLINQNNAVRPICMPLTIEMQTQTLPVVIVTGWGKTENGSSSDELLQARLPTIANDLCNQRYYARYRGRVTISSFHLCAGGNESDSCQGDSGGPAIYQSASTFGPRSVQYGIVAAGTSQCGGNVGIYTRVVKYMKWILDTCDE